MQRLKSFRIGNVVLALAAAFVLLALLSGCERPQPGPMSGERGTVSAGQSGEVLGGPGEEVTINIRNFRFVPGDITIKRGTKIVFVNEDDVEHNILQSSPHRVGAQPTSFESPILFAGQRWSKVFNEPGEFPIVCTVDGHQLMGMVGTIVVVD